jgi:hypothetical protein
VPCPAAAHASLVSQQDNNIHNTCYTLQVHALMCLHCPPPLLPSQVRLNMNKGQPDHTEGLAALYVFGNTGVRPAEGGSWRTAEGPAMVALPACAAGCLGVCSMIWPSLYMTHKFHL